jgi:hypothetical protein
MDDFFLDTEREPLAEELLREQEERRAFVAGVRGAFRAQATVAEILCEATGLDHALPAALEGLCEAFEFQLATLWTVTAEGERLVCECHHSDGHALRFSAATQVLELGRGDGPAGTAWIDAEQVWGSDFRGLVGAPQAAIAAAEGLRSVCAIPVVVGGTVHSVLELASYTHHAREETMSLALTAIAGQLGQFVERELIQERYVALSALLEQQVYVSAAPLAA